VGGGVVVGDNVGVTEEVDVVKVEIGELLGGKRLLDDDD